MFKNLYRQEEYSVNNTPYKVRGAFIPKKDKLGADIKSRAEDTPENKSEKLKEEIAQLNEEIKAKKSEIDALKAEQESMIGKAEMEISQMMSSARSEAAALKEQQQKQGYEEGFDKGYYDGLEKGKNEAAQKYESLITSLTGITAEALAEKLKIIESTESEIVELSSSIARKIVNQELSSDKGIIVNFVKEAIKKLEDKEKIIIYCNPADIDLIKKHRSDFMELVDTADTLHILPDEILSQGECRLESKSEIADTDLDCQFSEIRKKLLTGE